jgi:hypothetical protein
MVQDKNGNDVEAEVLEDTQLTKSLDDMHDNDGYATVKYIDYDQQKSTSIKPFKETITTYKVTTSNQAYTKVYVAPKPPAKNGITLSEFNKIKNGMTYQQVVQIIGENGTLEASASSGAYTSKVYSWTQKGTYGSASISFMNNKVQAKAQAGLK